MDLQDEPRADAIHVARQTGSGATDGSGARKSQNPKRFQCTHPGCNKRFTRMEHMQRHSLNHTAGDSACPRCSATFKRPDLLDRHMNRHRQRDQEAGGPGCGTLDTRKRSWKAPDGSVVQKRPRPEAGPTGPWTASGFDSSIQVVSPPVSDEGRSGHQYQLGADNEEYFDGAFNVLDARQGSSAANARNDAPSNIHPDLTQSYHAAPRSPERPLSMLSVPETLPQIDPAVREQLLAVIEAANPSIPDQSSDSPIRDHPLLSLNSLQSWLDLYFTQFNTAYPLIHLPTFNPSQLEPLLLLSIILLGATYSDKNAHQLAVCIHDVIRPSIFAHAGFSPRPELWTLQTILLVECFGKSRAGQKQHDMSHLFHGLLINLIRRSDCQSIANVPVPTQDAAAQEKAWRHWAEAEQKKRLALLCFMWDTQHAVLFCQSLCMSAFELRCAMPCSQSVWEAPHPEAWASAWQQSSSYPTTSKSTVPLFLPMVKSYLTPTPGGSASHHDGINALSLVLALHGLMSVSWDMQRRDQTSLGVNSIIGTTSWKDLISKAYDRWKVDFDQYCQEAAAASAESGEDKSSEWATFAAAYGTIYHSAQALLYMDFLDIQIYAGARHILGRPVQQQDYVRSSKVVKRWAANGRERAATAAWHAARMLRDVMAPNIKTNQAESTGTRLADATHTSLFHVPWCLYLASLACWAFHHAKQGRKRSEEDNHDQDDDSDGSDDEMVWDSQREMEALVVGMAGSGKAESSMRDILASQGRRGTNGLVWVVADVLSKVRWGIVHGGVVVLRGLVPMRLINQYETT
ncbi:Zinc finger protein klf1 [Cytospora mali]|uniref:Zinc finger protein klf1 n=1 Tax=Cytospora mali TaxID=578113 RepID=A0A194V5F3_CYTMA|nr:Zinc finger protein klf1 [Valsa mali var. pyri (nom. inval.)]